MINTDNSKASVKKRKAPPGAWKPGQSGNTSGAPKRGQSWAERIKEISEMTGPEVAALYDTRAKEFAKLPNNVTVKDLIIISVFGSMLREPSPGLWTETMNRADGKVKEMIEHSGELHLQNVEEVLSKLYGKQ